MAFPASGIFVLPFSTALADTLGSSYLVNTNMLALFNNSITPDPTFYEADPNYGASTWGGNEVTTATHWPAGGFAVSAWPSADTGGTASWDTTTTVGSLILDASDVSKDQTTLALVMGCLYYKVTANDALLAVKFAAAVSTTNGTFEIVWATPANGAIFRLDLTP